jgi:hypothetical protein
MKILILTLTFFDDGIYKKFYDTQKLTWDSIDVEDIETMFYIGNQTENKIEGNIIHTKIQESISNCGYKTLEAFEQIKNFDFDYIYRTNSSSYVDKNLLKKHISEYGKNSIYSGVVGECYGINFASGCGYTISKDLVHYVIENKSHWDHGLIDDVAISKLLSRINVYPTQSPRYDIYDINENISMDCFHYRIKNHDRNNDCEIMKKLHTLKNEYHNRK